MLSSGLDSTEEFLWIRDDENRTLMIERFRRKILIANEEPEESTMFFDPSWSQRLMLIIETFILE